jgi:hypothetical protein
MHRTSYISREMRRLMRFYVSLFCSNMKVGRDARYYAHRNGQKEVLEVLGEKDKGEHHHHHESNVCKTHPLRTGILNSWSNGVPLMHDSFVTVFFAVCWIAT